MSKEIIEHKKSGEAKAKDSFHFAFFATGSKTQLLKGVTLKVRVKFIGLHQI